MTKKIDKETLLDDYFRTATDVFDAFESIFQVEGVCSQIFGTSVEVGCNFHDSDIEDIAKRNIRSSDAWQSLSRLYDYAVDGILPDSVEPEEVVTGGAEVLSYIRTENRTPSDSWERIAEQGDGRFALDSGEDPSLDKLALLAAVEIRTVRNAVSAGELIKDSGSSFVNNLSARNWLCGRRGFKPTRVFTERHAEISGIATPVEFGSFLKEQRKRLGPDSNSDELATLHPSIDNKAIAEVESGVFKLPLDTVFPLADFYRLDRNELLETVMRIFFKDQLVSLTDSINSK